MSRTDEETHAHLCAHEAGHIVNAWLSPFVTQLEELVFRPGHNARFKFMGRPARRAIDDWYQLAITLGGMAGETFVFGTFRSGNSRIDLERARKQAERVVASDTRAPWTLVIGTWHLPFEQMYRSPLGAAVSAVMLEGYRKARKSIHDNQDAFARASSAVGNRRDMIGPELDRLFGPRPWAGL